MQDSLSEYAEGINWNQLTEDVVQWRVSEEQDDDPWDSMERYKRINY